MYALSATEETPGPEIPSNARRAQKRTTLQKKINRCERYRTHESQPADVQLDSIRADGVYQWSMTRERLEFEWRVRIYEYTYGRGTQELLVPEIREAQRTRVSGKLQRSDYSR